ncbi:50S ribosomal protein L11 methyltransferase [Wenzhouxiangella marina]|uniref:Ribosomal protein L11 methyltransferase n=1 Tax=Wenzhouxiangella marina TaxID=1579979 RepID=A0A0K0XTI5_9GAMM|nr:50S ribosomal protein L11 methyltransferase [Wenzhouxiangella marina]AKS40936.1 ribosomal protein L11 methyltransferase [Wenzhouxiangella marina]MBB6087810.1 ribosomal protein L11 methyltransferase [Wenzhouxiangella marina]
MSENDTQWYTVRLVLEPSQIDAAEDALFEQGAQAVTLLDAEDHPVHEPGPGERLLWPQVLVEALFDHPPALDTLASELSAAGVLVEASALQTASLADRDWVRAWMDEYQPMRFGAGLWICPNHIEPDPAWPRVIRLDPGLAFGSGTHPTTALCLEWLDGQDLSGQTVIDYGCGSGILAIAAALQGAERVIGVDHDPQAIEATRDNAQRNGVADAIEALLPADFQPEPCRLVLANILAGPLIELSDRICDCLAPGGRLVLSGILETQAEDVAAAYRSRLGEPTIAVRDGWVRLVFEG